RRIAVTTRGARLARRVLGSLRRPCRRALPRRIAGRLRIARIAAADVGRRLVLTDQPGKLGKRIAAGRLACRLRGAPIGIIGAMGSKAVVVRHTHSVSGTGVALGRFSDGIKRPKSNVPMAPSETNASPQAPRRRATLARTRER